MRINSLKNTPDRAGRYWGTFDDGTRLGLYRQTVEDFGLYIGKELTDEEAQRVKQGEKLTWENAEPGWTLLVWHKLPMSFMKNSKQ